VLGGNQQCQRQDRDHDPGGDAGDRMLVQLPEMPETGQGEHDLRDQSQGHVDDDRRG
jgi:hypothetical protein